MTAIVFDLAAFKIRYPEFAAAGDTLLAAYFTEATLYCNNSDGSLIRDTTIRSLILNMLVAHIAALAAAPLVGRVNSATEGSVTVQATMAAPVYGRAWFDQTKYGAAAWQAMSPYRRGFYIPPPMTPTTYIPEA